MSGSVLAVSGNASNESNAGAFYTNSNNGSENRNANIGRQLSYYYNILRAGIPASRQNTHKLLLWLVAFMRTPRGIIADEKTRQLVS